MNNFNRRSQAHCINLFKNFISAVIQYISPVESMAMCREPEGGMSKGSIPSVPARRLIRVQEGTFNSSISNSFKVVLSLVCGKTKYKTSSLLFFLAHIPKIIHATKPWISMEWDFLLYYQKLQWSNPTFHFY